MLYEGSNDTGALTLPAGLAGIIISLLLPRSYFFRLYILSSKLIFLCSIYGGAMNGFAAAASMPPLCSFARFWPPPMMLSMGNLLSLSPSLRAFMDYVFGCGMFSCCSSRIFYSRYAFICEACSSSLWLLLLFRIFKRSLTLSVLSSFFGEA